MGVYMNYRGTIRDIFKNKYLYILIAPGFILFYVLFCYMPMYGVQIAFKEFEPMKGFWGSSWIGLYNFENLFIDNGFWVAFINTIVISFTKIIFTFPIPIILALILNDLKNRKFKKVLQTVYTFPHFLSWVIISGIIFNMLGSDGAVNTLLSTLHINKVNFLGNPDFFRPLLYLSEIWKESGWGSIIYLAAMVSINPEMYEAADIDGAGRFRKMISITIPEIKPTIILLLILAIGNTMNSNFDQVFNLYNPVVYGVGDILDTYIFRVTFGMDAAGDLGFSTAIGLFKSIVNLLLLVSANKLAEKTTGSGLF